MAAPKKHFKPKARRNKWTPPVELREILDELAELLAEDYLKQTAKELKR